MSKFVITKEMIPPNEDIVLTCKSGDQIHVKRHIPYFQKEYMALELATYTSVNDDEEKMMYASYKTPLIEMLMIAKYYTNIDVASLKDEDDWRNLFDFIMNNDLYEQLMVAIEMDYRIVQKIEGMILDPAMEINRRNGSLGYRISEKLGETLGLDDLADSVAKSESVNNTMIDMISAYQDKKKAEHRKDMTLDNGAVISLARKNKQ